MIGSPIYMSPEQVRKPRAVDVRTDVWSLGIILYELVVGAPPFEGETALSMLAAIVSDPLPNAREKCPEMPAGLESVIAKCLQKSPDARYQNIGELARALEPYAPDSARASVQRISRVVRAFATPVADPAHTLASAKTSGERVRGELIREEASRPPATPVRASSGHNDTQKSSSPTAPSESPRRDVRSNANARRVALGVLAGGATAAVLLFWLRPPARNDDAKPAISIEPVAAAAPTRAPTVETSLVAAPSAPLDLAATSADAGHPERSLAVAPAKITLEPRRDTSHAQPAATLPAAARPPRMHAAPASPEPDPLDGRR